MSSIVTTSTEDSKSQIDDSVESKYRKTYKAVLEISKNLDSIYKSSNAILKIFQPETTLLRDRLRQYSETLLFRQPIEYGRKVEEILWRRVFYDIVHIVKSNKKCLKSNDGLEALYRLHLASAFGYYNQLIIRLRQEFHGALRLDDFLDFSLPNASPLFSSSNVLKYDSNSLRDFSVKLLHKFLICLGDLTRYQMDYDQMACTRQAEKYYTMSLVLMPEHGMPLNQLGTLYSRQNYGFDSAFYYIYCLSCTHSFSGSRENLKLLFIKNRKRYEDLRHFKKLDANDVSFNIKEFNVKQVKKFLVSFLYLIDLFQSDIIGTSRAPIDINTLQELCQVVLLEFNTCMYFACERDQDRLAYLTNDMVFKLMLITLMTVERLKKHKYSSTNRSSTSKNTILFTAIAFAFLLFGHILSHAINRFEKDILSVIQIEEKEVRTQEAYSSSGTEQELSENEKIHLLFSRRRRRRNSDSESDSDESNDSFKYNTCRQSKAKKSVGLSKDEDLSEDNLSILSEYSDKLSEDITIESLAREDSTQEETHKNENLKEYLTKLQPIEDSSEATGVMSSNFHEFSKQLTNTFMDSESNSVKSFGESNGFIDNELYKRVLAGKAQVRVPPGFEANANEAKVIEEIGEKIAKFQIETDTEMSTALSDCDENCCITEKNHQLNENEIKTIIDTFSKQTLLPTIKIFCDWLLCNRKLIQTVSQVSQTIWSKLSVLLNCIPFEKELANSITCRNSPFVQTLIYKSFETIQWNTHPLFEDMQTRSFDALKSEHHILKFDLNKLSKLNAHEETLVRLCCLRRFGYLLASLSQTQAINFFSYDACRERFVAFVTKQPQMLSNQNQQAVSDDKDRKFRFMKDLAQLRLQAEISQLEQTVQTQLSLYIVPDANSLCFNLKLVQDLARANKFIIIIPLVVIDTLDAMKRESKMAREAIRWLETQFKQGNRFIRAQVHNEKNTNNRNQSLKSKDLDAWRLQQLIDCCKYFKQQLEVNRQNEDEMVTLLTNHDLNDIEQNDRLKSLVQMAKVEQIGIKCVREFHEKLKVMT